MQEAEPVSEPAADPAAPKGPWRHAPWLALLVLVVAGTWLLAERPNRAVFDQHYILAPPEVMRKTPTFSDGVTTKTITALVRATTEPGDFGTLNFRVRALALAAYLGAGFLLARAVLPGPAFVVVFLGLLFASRMPMIWISSELFAGAFACLAALATLRSASPWGVGALLAVGAHTKPDMPVLMGAMLLAYGLHVWSPRSFGKAVAGFALAWLAVTVPYQLQSEGRFYHMGRSFTSFSQHYASLVTEPSRLREVTLEGGDPRPERYAREEPLASWTHHRRFTHRDFPDVKSVGEVVTRYPEGYLRFLGLSLERSAQRVLGFFHVLGALLLARYVWLLRRREPPDGLDRLFLASLVAIGPMILLAFVHVRYLARWLPFVLILVLDWLARLEAERAPRWLRGTTLAGLAVFFVTSSVLFARDWGELEDHHVFWFPD